jgi:tetratricopeptide (TPR) repeat protein
MKLADERLKGLDNPALTIAERAVVRCQVAADFILAGQYETACEALGELWRGIGERPNLEGLDEKAAAEVLLQVGALSGWIGASQQVAGAQERAKELISESVTIFEQTGEVHRAALARSDLALCYWREGAYDDARAFLEHASDVLKLADADAELRMKVLLRRVTVEYMAGRLNDALNILQGYATLLNGSASYALIGSFHNHLALVLRGLGVAEGYSDYFDRAIIEYTAAIYHYQQAGHERYSAVIENNLAFLLYKLGRYEEAHEQLDRAGVTLVKLNDAGLLAQVDETRAHVLIAEKRYREANKAIGRAIRTLAKGGEAALLAYAYEVQGVVWARLGAYENSLNILRHAVNLAEESGALSNAALIALTLIEEHGAIRLPEAELFGVYMRADELLKSTQDAEEVSRLRGCARVVIKRVAGMSLHDRNFSLHGAVHDLEARLIARALGEAGGSVTKAARLLGVSHQLLTNMLNTRHTKLQQKRTPVRKRLRSIIPKDKKE